MFSYAFDLSLMDSKTSWRGALEMMQPVGALIGYLLLFYYVYIVVNGEKNRKTDMLSFLNRIFVVAATKTTTASIIICLLFCFLCKTANKNAKIAIPTSAKIPALDWEP